MAKPVDITLEDEAKLRSYYNLQPGQDLSKLYSVLPESRIKEVLTLAPATPAPARPSPPATTPLAPVTPPAAVPARPVPPATVGGIVPLVTSGLDLSTAAGARAASAAQQVQPEGDFPVRSKFGQGSGSEQLNKATSAYRQDVAEKEVIRGPLAITPEEAKVLIDRGQKIATDPRTVSGERRYLTPIPERVEQVLGPGITSTVIGGLLPQVIQSPEQALIADREAYAETQAYFKARPDLDISRFKEVYDAYRAKPTLSQKSATGAIIESPLSSVGRLLNVGEAAIVSGARYAGDVASEKIEQITTGKDVKDPQFLPILKSELTTGGGITAAGGEAFKKAAVSMGFAPDAQDFMESVGMGLGLVTSLAVPVDLGIASALSTGLKTGMRTGQVAKAFKDTTAGVGLATVKGGVRGAVEGTFDAWRVGSRPSGGEKAISSALEEGTKKWLNAKPVDNVTKTTILLAQDPQVQSLIRADREAGSAAAASPSTPYDQSTYLAGLEDAFNRGKAANPSHPIASYPTFGDWVSAAESHGIDIGNSAGRRASVLEAPPSNVVIRETRDALKTTSQNTPSLDYFDQLAIGERADLYFNAYLETTDEAVKRALLTGGSVKSSEFLPSLDRYINDIRVRAGSEAKAAPILAQLEADLRAIGFQIPAGRFGTGGALPSGDTYGGLISIPGANDALAKSYKIDLGRKLLADFAGSTGIVGRSRTIGNVTLSTSEAKKVLAKVQQNMDLSRIRAKFTGKAYKGGPVKITPEEVAALEAYFITPYLKTATAEGKTPDIYFRPTGTYSPVGPLSILTRAKKTGEISGTSFNDLIRSAIDIESSSKITVKTKADIGRIASTLKAGNKGGELSYFLRNVLTPPELKEAGLGAIMVDLYNKVKVPNNESVVANGIVAEVNARMGAIPERFKAKMRTLMGETGIPGTRKGLSRPQAFARTMIEEFTVEPVYKPIQGTTAEIEGPRNAEAIQKPFESVRAGEPKTQGEIDFARKQGAYEMFRTYVASLYGGYEQTIEAISTTGRSLELDKMAISTKETRDLVTVLMDMEGSIYNRRLNEFLDALDPNNITADPIQAINILQRTHIDLFGYSIQESLTKTSKIPLDQIESLLQKATNVAKTDRLGNESLAYFGSKGSSTRSIGESYASGSQQAPLFKPENFKELLIGTYFTKAQANVIDDVLTKAQINYPDVFPSASTAGVIAADDWEITRAGLIYSLDKAKREASTAGLVDSEYMKAYNDLRAELVGKGDGPIEYVEVSRTEIDPLTGRPARKSVQINVKNKKQKMAEDLLIRAVQDRVGSVSGQVSAKSYKTGLVDAFEKPMDPTIRLLPGEVKKRRQLMAEAFDGLGTAPGSSYGSMFEAGARADATALFYQTSLTNLKNQLKNPFASSLQGVAEKVMTVPLLRAEETAIKKPLFQAANIKKATETIQAIQLQTSEVKFNQYVASGGKVLSEQISDMENLIDGVLSSELSSDVLALAIKKEKVIKGIKYPDAPVRRLVIEVLGEAVNAGKDFGGSLMGLAKNGMLGGTILPNLAYLWGNLFSGPAIITSTLGLSEGIKSVGRLFDPDVYKIMASIYTPGIAPNKIVVTTPSGEIYTAAMLADMVNAGVIGRSQASAELSNSLLKSSIDWAGSTGLYGDFPKVLGINLPNVSKIPVVGPTLQDVNTRIVKGIKRNFINVNDANIYSAMANAVDQTYRIGVLKAALSRGETVEAAGTLAREALFDYGNLTYAEKSIISKGIWFWTFARNNYRTVLTGMLTDPKRLKAAFAIGEGGAYLYNLAETKLGFDPEDIDMRYAMKDYTENRMFIDLVEDKELAQRFAVLGTGVPQLGAMAELIDFLSIPVAAAAWASGLSSEPYGAGKVLEASLEVIAEKSNPFLELFMSQMLGVDVKRSGQKSSAYLDPKILWYMQQSPEQFYTFAKAFKFEQVPLDEESPTKGYYNGHQWRIPFDEKGSIKRWNLMMGIIQTIGIKRGLADYAPMWDQMGAKGVGSVLGAPVLGAANFPPIAIAPALPASPAGEVTYPVQISTSSVPIDWLRALGVIAVQDVPTIEETQRANRLAAGRELGKK